MTIDQASKLPIFDLCVKITSGFEGTDYGTVTGNFDGQGISAGILQWNLGQGTLQSYILNSVNLMMYDYFPARIDLLKYITPQEAVRWAKDVVCDASGKMLPQWHKSFNRFMLEPSVISAQKKAIDLYFHQAKTICGKLGLSHENRRGMAFSFDIAVQNWSLNIDVPEPNITQAENILNQYAPINAELWLDQVMTKEKSLLVIAAHYRALKSKKEWRADVFTRKCTIAMGIGIVHKKKYYLEKLY